MRKLVVVYQDGKAITNRDATNAGNERLRSIVSELRTKYPGASFRLHECKPEACIEGPIVFVDSPPDVGGTPAPTLKKYPKRRKK